VLTVKVNDGSADNNLTTRSFQVTVAAVNQPPTLNPLSDLKLNVNAGPQVVQMNGITCGSSNEVQALTVTAISSDPALIPHPLVTYTNPGTLGSLRFTPAANLSGLATVTVVVDDGQSTNRSITRTFAVAVGQVAEPPKLSVVPPDLVVAGTESTSITVAATGAGPLAYQWYKNGVAIPEATASSLRFGTTRRADSGQYTVRVSNTAGAVVSPAAYLRVMVPQRVSPPIMRPDGSVLLDSRDADGNNATQVDVQKFELWASTDLVNWELTQASISLNGGGLRIIEQGATNRPKRYYKVIEKP